MMNPLDAARTNGATNVVISSTRPSGYPGSGSYSLVVPVAINAAGSWEAEVGTVFCPNSTISVGGYSISGYVYFDGAAFPEYAVLAAYTWAGTDSSTAAQRILMSNAGSSTIATRTWLPFSQTFNSSYVANRLNLTVAPNGPWTGTVYFDDIKVTGF